MYDQIKELYQETTAQKYLKENSFPNEFVLHCDRNNPKKNIFDAVDSAKFYEINSTRKSYQRISLP